MNFNPDLVSQAQEVIFSRKTQKQKPRLFSNQVSVTQTISQKHLGTILHSQLDFKEHLQNIFNKVGKITSLLWKLQNVLLRFSLLTTFYSYDLSLITVILSTIKYICFFPLKTRDAPIQRSIGYDWCYQGYIQRKYLPRIRLLISPVTTLV